jgi:hypothetical protein
MRALLQRLLPELRRHALLRSSCRTGFVGYGLSLGLAIMLDDPTIEAAA